MLKDILAVVEDGNVATGFLKTIGALARAHDAYLRVIALTPAPMASPALAPFGSLYIPDVILMGDDAANVATIRACLDETGCTYDVAGFHDDVAGLAGNVKRSHQLADIVIVAAEESWPTRWLRNHVIETLIRSAGTPLLILPAGRTLAPVNRAVLGWKPSPEANRAAHALVRFTEAGAVVDVVTMGIDLAACGQEADSQAEVKRHLLAHGLQAAGHCVVNDEKLEAEILSRYATETNADLLVVGGFAHSRIRDIILGGVTRDFVRCVEVPTLICG